MAKLSKKAEIGCQPVSRVLTNQLCGFQGEAAMRGLHMQLHLTI